MANDFTGAKFNPPLNRINRKISSAGRKLSKIEVPNKKCSILLDQWVLQNFATQGGKVGGWPPFKHPEWGRYLPGVGWDPSAKLLQDTGRLKRSFRPWYNRRTAGIGSNLPYSKPHEEGTSKLPQRRILPRSNLDNELMEKFYVVYDKHVKASLETMKL